MDFHNFESNKMDTRVLETNTTLLEITMTAFRISVETVKESLTVDSSKCNKKENSVSNLINSCTTEYTLKEVLEHDTSEDCWIIVNDKVYDITTFLELVRRDNAFFYVSFY